MKKRSVLYTWAIEFAILLALMTAMCITLTFSARRKLLDEYIDITDQQQDKIEIALNNSLSRIKADAINLACNSVIRSFALLSSPSMADNYTFYTIQSMIATPGNSGGEVIETYLYFQNLQKALTAETVYEKDALAAVLFGAGRESEKKFDELRSVSSLFRVVTYTSGGTTQILAVTSIPTQGSSPTALILQVLDPQGLEDIVASQATLEGSTTLLVDQDGQLICQSGDELLAEQLVRIAREKTLKYQIRLDGKNYYLLKKALWEKNWDLVTLVPVAAIAKKSNWVWKRSTVFLLIFLAVGVAAATSMVKLNYQPLQELTRSLPQKAENGTGQNEYQQINGAFHIYRRDLERLQIIQENQRISLQKELMQNLLEHDIDVSAFSGDVASWIQINTWGEWFVLLLLKEEGLDFSELGLDNVVLLHVQPHGIPTLCLFAKEEEPLRQSLGTVEEYLQENGVVYTSGSVRCGWKQIHSAFLSLCERNESMQEPLEAESTPAGKLSQRVVIVQGGEIARLTFAGNAEEAIRMLHHAGRMNFSSQPDMFLLRMLMTDVLMSMYNAVPAGDERGVEVQQAIVATSRALQKAMTHTEAEEQMDTLIGAVAAKYVPPLSDNQPELLSRILQCVQEHFCEHDFNVSRAADLLGLSVAYLSKYFKRQTGVNLLNYLNSLRIDYAKKLMDEEQITVAEAADRAGYENANTFIRLFKKYAGDTPGNYNKL